MLVAEGGDIFHVVDVVDKLFPIAASLGDDSLPVVHPVNIHDDVVVPRRFHQSRVPARGSETSSYSGIPLLIRPGVGEERGRGGIGQKRRYWGPRTKKLVGLKT